MRERFFLMVVCLVSFPSILCATEVTFRLENQNNELIPESYFDVVTTGKNSIPQNGTATLAPGVHTIVIRPGINKSFFGTLQRQESVTIGGFSQALTFKWKTAPLTVIVNDQSGKPIGGSLFRVGTYRPGFIRDYATVDAGKLIQLPVTEDSDFAPMSGTSASGYELKLLPGINGHQGFLERFEPAVELTIGGLTQTFTWKTALVQVTLTDDKNATIPGSLIRIGVWRPGVLPRDFATIDTGKAITLPVTEDPGTPPITGISATGYEVKLLPGINGHQGFLERLEPVAELTASGITWTRQWRTAPLTVSLIDQTGAAIPASLIRIGVWRPGVLPRDFATIDAGKSITLPVTEDPGAAPITGISATGYEVKLLPGINGHQNLIDRLEAVQELTTTGIDRTYVWQVARGTLHVVDSAEKEVAGASFSITPPLNELKTGTFVTLPINDKALYPTIGGPFAAGYPIAIRVATGGALQPAAKFVLQFGKTFAPLYAPIASAQYGVRFDLQRKLDVDGDGFPNCVDCNDFDPKIHPRALELPGDTVDEDCDAELSCSPTATYRNHEAYIACVTTVVDALFRSGRITETEKTTLMERAK